MHGMARGLVWLAQAFQQSQWRHGPLLYPAPYHTCRCVRKLADPGEEPDPDKSPGAAALAAGSAVLMARSNWHVHSLGRGGGVRWNVTFGRVQQLSLPALRALVDSVDMPLPHARTPPCAFSDLPINARQLGTCSGHQTKGNSC